MEFSEIASVSGKGGLFKVINPTRTGAVLESLTDGKKMIVGMQAKVSVLSDISIYTTEGDGAVPLHEVMIKIHEEFSGDTDLDKNSDTEELKAFLRHVLPTYDEDRVYISDIKKLVTWYNQLAQIAPELVTKSEEKITDKSDDKKEEAGTGEEE